jgi:hypothetical protein
MIAMMIVGEVIFLIIDERKRRKHLKEIERRYNAKSEISMEEYYRNGRII